MVTGVEEVVPADEAKQQVITDAQVLELAEYAKAIEEHYGCYMDMEWGVDERNDKIWILQARPETVWSRKEKSETSGKASTLDAGNRDIIVKGLPASLVMQQVKLTLSSILRISMSSKKAKFLLQL